MEKINARNISNAWGMSAAIDLYGCRNDLMRDPDSIERFIIELCDLIGMKRHGPALIERFGCGELCGYSAMQFIETSSITIHLDEFDNRGFIDIFSCKKFDEIRAENFCKIFFHAEKSTMTVNERGRG